MNTISPVVFIFIALFLAVVGFLLTYSSAVKDTNLQEVSLITDIGLTPTPTSTPTPAPTDIGLLVATWNMAAINNNPFEYWITYDKDKAYNKLMSDFSNLMKSPGKYDLPAFKVFTDVMFAELADEMTQAGFTGIGRVKTIWQTELRNRLVVTEFIKDDLLGKKRLISMPDRVTNTIRTSDGKSFFRPTVINCYDGGDLSTLPEWWVEWKKFMFHTEVMVDGELVPIYSMLTPILKAKYPAITDEEAALSLPLQIVHCAMFDGILVSLMKNIARTTWQGLRKEICDNLNTKKNEISANIIKNYYDNVKIMFLQEVSKEFAHLAESVKDPVNKGEIGDLFDVYAPATIHNADSRDQNSLILLKKNVYSNVVDITDIVIDEISTSSTIGLAAGDLLVLTAVDAKTRAKYVLASFHGDTNGLQTEPVVKLVTTYVMSFKSDHKLLFGMDANTYEHPESDQQGVVQFGEFFSGLGLNSCYGMKPDPTGYTTFHARTYLQSQLNKAVSLEERDVKGDKNPKDFILFYDSDFRTQWALRDNTGSGIGHYTKNMIFPTLTFPSDHAITAASLIEKELGPKSRTSLRVY